MKRKAFTLIEALVCLACIGILLAILTVAVQAARESSRRAVCANNLKSLGDGIQIYLNTHSTFPESISREQFSHSGRPPTVAFPGPAIQTLRSASGNSVYVELLISYGFVSGYPPDRPDVIDSLEGHHGLMMCPSNPKTGTSIDSAVGVLLDKERTSAKEISVMVRSGLGPHGNLAKFSMGSLSLRLFLRECLETVRKRTGIV